MSEYNKRFKKKDRRLILKDKPEPIKHIIKKKLSILQRILKFFKIGK